MSNATLTTIKGFQAPRPDLTVTLNRADLNQVMMGLASFDDLIKDGKAKFEGDRSGSTTAIIIVPFTPDFEILPGTAPKQRPICPNRSRSATGGPHGRRLTRGWRCRGLFARARCVATE